MQSTDHEAVLRRAIELDRRLHEIDAPVTDAILVATAKELDIPVAYVAQALAEVRVGAGKPTWLDRVLGPAEISRSLSSDSAVGLDDRLEEWLVGGHGLRSRRTPEGTITGSRRRDPIGRVVRAGLSVRGMGGLGRLRQVRATSVQVDDHHSAICLLADVREQRRHSVMVGSALGTTAGVATAFTLAVLPVVPLVAVAALPVAAGVAFISSRNRHRNTVEQVAADLDAAAWGVATGQRPPTVAASLRRRAMRRQGLSPGP